MLSLVELVRQVFLKVATAEFPFLPRGKRVELPSRLAVVGEGLGNAQVQLKLIICLLANSTESWTTCIVVFPSS